MLALELYNFLFRFSYVDVTLARLQLVVLHYIIQGDQKVSVHLMITVQKHSKIY
jgi:hypothetical protein